MVLIHDLVIAGINDVRAENGMPSLEWDDGFGDNWEFDVTLERIDPVDVSIKEPIVLESHGEPPEQYGFWDEAD